MKKIFHRKKILLVTSVLLTIMMFLTACNNEGVSENVAPEENLQEEVTEETDESIYISLEEAKSWYEDESYVFVDARLSDAYNGWALDGIGRGGHIPNAVDLPYNWLTVEVDDKEEQLEKALETKGITMDKNIIVYDVQGKNALAVYDYLSAKGFENVAMFDLNLWIQEESLALEKLPNYEKVVPAAIVKAILEGEKPETFENSNSIKVVEASWGPEDS